MLFSCGENNVIVPKEDCRLNQRAPECFAKGKYLEPGTPDWERFCEGMPDGFCCWTNHEGCCLWKVQVPPDPKIYTNPDGTSEVYEGTPDTVEVSIQGSDTLIVYEVN